MVQIILSEKKVRGGNLEIFFWRQTEFWHTNFGETKISEVKFLGGVKTEQSVSAMGN